MATFEITAPDGRVFEVEGPEGSTKEQALAQVQAQYKPQRLSASALTAIKLGRGLAQAGPLGMGAAAVGHAIEELEKGAYAAGGKVTDLTGSPVAGAVTNVTLQAPLALAGGGAGLAAKAPMRAGAEWLMQSALKPSMKALERGKGDPAIRTLLDEGITISRGGVEKLEGKVDALSSAITSALKDSGATIDKNAVASRLQDLISKIEKTSLTPQDRVAEVERVYTQVLSNPNLERMIPVEQAQQIKLGIYALIKKEYGKLGSDSIEAQKALARGLKEEISAAVPGVGQMNAKESQLLNALELANHRALQTRNKDIGGLAWLIENPLRFAAFMADKSPAFKSALARLVNTGSENAPAIGAAVGATTPQERR